MVYKSGAKYSGDWKNGKADGYGIMVFDSGDKYYGEYKNDKTHGIGSWYYAESGDVWNTECEYGEFVKEKCVKIVRGEDARFGDGTSLKK